MADLSQVFKTVSQKFGFDDLNDHQKEAIGQLLKGKDVFVSLPTGFGKSVIFQALPLVFDECKPNVSGHIVLVISPLLSLIQDQINRLNQLNVDAVSLSEVTTEAEIDKVEKGVYKVIYTTPESLIKNERWRRMLSSEIFTEKLCAIAIDEAHVVKQWGTSTVVKLAPFRECYGRLKELRSLTKTPIIALTATATAETKKEIIRSVALSAPHVITESPDKPNITYVVNYLDNKAPLSQHFTWLVNEAKENGQATERTIIYTQTIQQCANIFITLKSMLGKNYYTGNVGDRTNVLLEMLHSCSPSSNKEAVLKSFQENDGTIRILVATIAFGMGVDCRGVHRTIHFGPSKNLEAFVQEAGRSGRDGVQSTAYVLYNGLLLSHVEDDIKGFVQLQDCRRKGLMKHFDEKTCEVKVKHLCCDNCSSLCQCGKEDCKSTAVYPDLVNTDNTFSQQRETSTEQKKMLEKKLNNYHRTLTAKLVASHANGSIKAQTPLLLLIGFSQFQVEQVLHHCHHLFSLDDICKCIEIWDMKHAVNILRLIHETFGDLNTTQDTHQPTVADELYQMGADLEDELDMAIDEWNYLLEDDDFIDQVFDNLDGTNISSFNDNVSDLGSHASEIELPNDVLALLENYSFQDV